MSAGGPAPKVSNDISKLAPRFKAAVEAALAECQAAGYDAVVFEAYRSKELADIYYARGRTVKPPEKPVTNAKDNVHSWHGFSCAVDVISKSNQWFNPDGKADLKLPAKEHPDYAKIQLKRKEYSAKGEKWFAAVGAIFEKHGCTWGGRWKQRDTPHMQAGACPASPTDADRKLLQAEGMEAVWRKYKLVP